MLLCRMLQFGSPIHARTAVAMAISLFANLLFAETLSVPLKRLEETRRYMVGAQDESEDLKEILCAPKTNGEVLRIGASQCCPECVPRTRGSCHDGKKIHAHGTQWASSPCSMCSCTHGEVRCSRRPCPPLLCAHQQLEFIPEGGCCPVCVGPGKPCTYEGRVFQDGEDWPLSRCAKCVCRNGATQCFAAQCQPLFCNQVRKTL
ncbi:hypothetical protein MC885_008049, partial [Smutsia gigantea]